MDDKTQTEDRRIRRTKRLLTQGLMKLMQEKPLQDITVRELADECDINRGTFYLYYRDISDMLEKIQQDMFERFDQILTQHAQEDLSAQTMPVLRDLIGFIQENRDMCRVLLSENGNITFLQKLYQVVRDRCLHDWSRMNREQSDNQFEYRFSYAAFGCIGIIRNWVNDEHPISSEQLARLLETMIRRGALAALG